MLKRWLLAAGLGVTVLAGALPAYAQGPNGAVTDDGRNVYTVDATLTQPNNLLPAEQVRQIVALQQGRRAVVPASPVSPDDQVLLISAGGRYAFLTLDGELQARVDSAALDDFFGTDEFRWLNNATLAQIGYAQVAPDTIAPAFLTIDRASGAVDIDLINVPEGLVLASLAPNGGKLLLLSETEVADAAGQQRSTGQRITRLPAWRQAQLDALVAAHPALARHHAVAALLDPTPYELQVILRDTRLSVLDLATGSQRELVTLPAGTRVNGLAWSPDGARLALSHTGVFFDVRPCPPNDERCRDGARISEERYRDVTGNLDPAKNPRLQRAIVDSFELNKGEAQRLRAATGDDTVFGEVSWATDGQTLMVQHLQPARIAGRRFPVYDHQFLAGGSFRFYDPALRELRRLVAPALSGIDSELTYGRFVSPDEVIFSAHSGTDTRPYYYNLRSGELRAITNQAGTVYALTASSSSARQLLFFYDSFTEPGELYRVGWDGSGLTALTAENAELRTLSRTQQHVVAFTLPGGKTRTGVLILPADVAFPPKNQRIVVWQEGGPTTSVQNRWDAAPESPFALLPNFGVGVLVTPLYGRYGLGAERFTALVDGSNFGQIDIDEQAAIVRQLEARGWAQRGQVGIAGCSYGGYFVTQSLARHPGLYGAGNAMCSLVDSAAEWSGGYRTLMPWLQGLPPFANPEEYRKDSPLYNAGKVTTPLLSFHGEEDFLPVTQMENYHLQLVNREVPAKLLKFVWGGHGLNAIEIPMWIQEQSTPEELQAISDTMAARYELYGAQEQILWFQEHLK